MKNLSKQDILDAAEFIKEYEELENKLQEHKKNCKHWVISNSEISEVCILCNKVIKENSKNEHFYDMQKKIFENKYRINNG